MLNYLRDYGAVGLSDRGLNDVDRLVFSQLVYLNFDVSLRNVLLGEALESVDFGAEEPSEVRFGFQHRDDRKLCALAACRRYEGIRLVNCVRSFSAVRERQFAAMTLRMPDGALMIVFRGTDNTLAGWKEDFNLAFLDEIPSQGMACAYVDEVARDADTIELCGHSKGGNLALYAAVNCAAEIQARIRDAVSFDGPGLSRSVIGSEVFIRISDRLRLRIPQASLVGLLFHQPEDVRVVECRGLSLLQHYPYFWKCEGMDLKYTQHLSPAGRKLGQSVCGTIEKLPQDVRERLVETIYEIISTTGAETLNDLVNVWVSSTPAVLKKLRGMDRGFYRMLLKILAAFWVSAAESFGVVLKVNMDEWFRKDAED